MHAILFRRPMRERSAAPRRIQRADRQKLELLERDGDCTMAVQQVALQSVKLGRKSEEKTSRLPLSEGKGTVWGRSISSREFVLFGEGQTPGRQIVFDCP